MKPADHPNGGIASPGKGLDDTRDRNIGGQAVIEGVMMRSPGAIATAVRLSDGSIEVNKRPFKPIVKRYPWLNIPVIRGAVNFFEMLVIGMETLNWSAEVQIRHEDASQGNADTPLRRFWNAAVLGFSLVAAFALALLLFFTLPIWIATLLGLAKGALVFNLVAGMVRLVLFVAYILVISRMKDIQRVFSYHGAEHMSIFTLEADEPLTVDRARDKSRFHPRCGTSFILIVALFSIILFSVADSLFPLIFGHAQKFFERLATHLLLLPAVAGISYELLKLSGRFRAHPLVQTLVMPGLLLQQLTTREPDDGMLEVALCALNAALETEEALS